MEQIGVLCANRSDEVVYPRHLQHGKQRNEYEPRRANLLRRGAAVQRAPDTGDVLLLLFRSGLLGAVAGAEETGDFADDGVAMGFARVLEALDGGGVVEFVVGVVGDLFFFGGGDELADGFVGDGGHEEDLHHEDEGGHDQVDEEEVLDGEVAVCGLVGEPVDEEDGTGGVEGAGEEGEDQPRVLRECVAELERGDEYEGAAERHEEVPGDVGIEGELFGEGE